MKIFNITKPIAILATGLLILTSCENFLDVEPNSQVKGDELLSNESGFKEALAGVYISMISESTYAKELRFGMMGVMASEWDYYPSASYQDAVAFKYDQAIPKGMIDRIWRNMYNSIANVNNIIAQIDAQKNTFTNDNYNIIKGEAYGLRALLHFDLLRCFGVSYAVDSTKAAIPYCTALITGTFPQLKVNEVMAKVHEDLAIAEACLENDPIKTGEIIDESMDNGYLINRQTHFNYYAVKALQARAYLWAGNYEMANQCARVVTGSQAFSWTTQENLQNGVDNSFASEHIFALNHEKLSNLADSYFNPEYLTSAFHSEEATIDALYGDLRSDDYRYTYNFEAGTGAYTSRRYTKKYGTPQDNPNSTDDNVTNMYYANKMPIMRLSEMYLIIAECEYQKQSFFTIDAINEVRKARGAKILTTDPADFYSVLIEEYQKEFLSEGIMFFLYKRLNQEYLPNNPESLHVTKGYTFPIPDSEKEAAIREENR